MSEHLDETDHDALFGVGCMLIGVSIFMAGAIWGVTVGSHHGATDLAGGLNYFIGLPLLTGIGIVGYYGIRMLVAVGRNDPS